MPFETILNNVFNASLDLFNKAEYKKLSNNVAPYAQLISPALDLPKIKSPAVHLKNFEEIVAYWTETNKSYENRITKTEFLNIGKISMVRCYYEKIDLVLDAEIFFDNYAKIIKIENHLVAES